MPSGLERGWNAATIDAIFAVAAINQECGGGLGRWQRDAGEPPDFTATALGSLTVFDLTARFL